MQPWARQFYNSKAWRECRDAYALSRFGLCERCTRPGLIVHHKVVLTPANIHDPNVTLNWGNLQLLCLDCHNREHGGASTAEGLEFDENGNLIPPLAGETGVKLSDQRPTLKNPGTVLRVRGV